MPRIPEPLVLLILTGGLIGATFPLGKLAGEAGIAPVVWSFLIAIGSALTLSIMLALRRRWLSFDAHSLRFYIVGGVVSYAAPNFLVFTVIPHLGAGFTSILFTLSPIVTLVLATIMRTRQPTKLGIFGIGIGFGGALLIVLSKGQIGRPAEPIWLAVSLLIPLTLAIGNVYRTLDWPPNSEGLALAVGTNGAAAIALAGLSLVGVGNLPLGPAIASPGLVAAQIAISALMFSFFFRLQRIGGPIYLSQIGYVAAAVGLAAGSLLGEKYGLATWLGALIVAVGVALTTVAQSKEQAPQGANSSTSAASPLAAPR